MTEPATPVKRGPGRPRKTPTAKPQVADETPVDAWKTPEPATFPPDERIGQRVDDPRWTLISFSEDNSEYRVEDGVIVERVR